MSPRRRPAPSTVLAALALVVAMSGSAVAGGMVTGHQIKNGTVTGSDVKNKSLKGVDVKDGSLTLDDLSATDRAQALAQAPQAPAPVTWWALVKSGNLVQGNGVASVTRSAAGVYLVYFAASVANSAISADLVGFGTGQVSVTACGSSPMQPTGLSCTGTNSNAEVEVLTRDSSGSSADADFVLVVHPAGATVGAVTP